MDRPAGGVTYACMLNRRGGVELDVTVTRLDEQSFLVVGPAMAQTKLYHWLRRHADAASAGTSVAAPGDRPVAATIVTDVTSGLGVLAVMGPSSRELLATLTDAPLDVASFPFGTAQRIEVGWTGVLALRVSFVGEMGWELYAPVESLAALYDRLVEAGAAFGLHLAGYHALDSLRAEKGLLHWGADIGPADTPYQAGLGFTVALDKAAVFVGREALRAAAAEPLGRRLVHVRIDDPQPLLYHGESLVFDGRIAGRVTSGAYGFTLGGAVGFAYVQAPPDELEAIVSSGGARIDVAGTLWPATLSRRPFYDPDGERMRGRP